MPAFGMATGAGANTTITGIGIATAITANMTATTIATTITTRDQLSSDTQDGARGSLDDPVGMSSETAKRGLQRPAPQNDQPRAFLASFFRHGGNNFAHRNAEWRVYARGSLNDLNFGAGVLTQLLLNLSFGF